MTATYEEADDAMKEIVDAAWQAGASAIAGAALGFLYMAGVEPAAGPDLTTYWARWSRQVVIEQQSTLRDGTNGRRFENSGLIFVQVYGPMAEAEGNAKTMQLANLVLNSMRGKETPNGVVFRNVRINPLEPDGKSYRFNVVAEYEYDEIA